MAAVLSADRHLLQAFDLLCAEHRRDLTDALLSCAKALPR
jgi:hypothetical protein